jgi:hypothetical protein
MLRWRVEAKPDLSTGRSRNPGAGTSSNPEGSAETYGVVLVTVLEMADRAPVGRRAITVPHDRIQFLNRTVPRSAEPIQYPRHGLSPARLGTEHDSGSMPSGPTILAPNRQGATRSSDSMSEPVNALGRLNTTPPSPAARRPARWSAGAAEEMYVFPTTSSVSASTAPSEPNERGIVLRATIGRNNTRAVPRGEPTDRSWRRHPRTV